MKQPRPIVHLCERSPGESGSFNHLVYRQIQALPQYEQYFICGDPNWQALRDQYPRLLGYSPTLTGRLRLLLPEPIRARLHSGIRSERTLRTVLAAHALLPRLDPALIICYDALKVLETLRSIAPRSRIMLYQRGFRYSLPSSVLQRIYSRETLDAVCHLTLESYLATREQLHSYEAEVRIIGNGLTGPDFCPPGQAQRSMVREKYGWSSQDLVVLLLSRLVPKKGIHIAIKAFSRIASEFPTARLWIVGYGTREYLGYLQGLVATARMENSVRFAGQVPRTVVPEIFTASDMYLFPTLCAEGSPGSLKQALASGLDVITSDYPGLESRLRPVLRRIVSSPNDSAEWVDAIRHVLRSGLKTEAERSLLHQEFISVHAEEPWLDALSTMYDEELACCVRN